MGRELGVRYVLEGSVRKAGHRIRITSQLVEAATGNHIWADRIDGYFKDIFDLQDRITESVVVAVEPRVLQSEIERARVKRREHLTAYDLYLRAHPEFQSYTQEGFARAKGYLEKAVAIDPNFADAWRISLTAVVACS
jgi:adenylate cyclase